MSAVIEAVRGGGGWMLGNAGRMANGCGAKSDCLDFAIAMTSHGSGVRSRCLLLAHGESRTVLMKINAHFEFLSPIPSKLN